MYILIVYLVSLTFTNTISMQINEHSKEKAFRIVACLFGLLTLVTQFILMQQGTTSVEETIARTIRFFSFMTILTNTLVAITYIIPVIVPSKKAGRFFANSNTQSAVLVYILIVCIGYHFLLANIWNPQGLQKVVDISLHYLVPLIYLAFWLKFVKKTAIPYSNIYKWLIYPFLYLIYAISRGLITSDYPYPFLDFSKHPVSRVLTIIVVLMAGYIIIGLLVIFIHKRFDMEATKSPAVSSRTE